MKQFKMLLFTTIITLLGYANATTLTDNKTATYLQKSLSEISQTEKTLRTLYIAYFDRAPDVGGLEYWNRAYEQYLSNGLDSKSAFVKIANEFLKNSQADTLNAQSNEEFVKSVYLNQLGELGDKEGIAFWTNALEKGLSRPEFMVEFITQALDITVEEVTSDNFPSLSSQELATAQKRVSFLEDKLRLSLSFTEIFGTLSNPHDNNNLDEDSSYQVSQLLMSEFKKNHDVEALESLMLRVKDETPNENEVMSALVVPLMENSFTIKVTDIPFREIGYSQHPSKVIGSQEELDGFITQIEKESNWNDTNKEKFLAQLNGLTMDFTIENLLFYRITEGSGSVSLSIQKPILSPSQEEVLIEIKRTTPEIGTTDMAYYALAYRVDKRIKEITFDNGTQEVIIENKSSNMVIPKNCTAWFDGCNDCSREPNGLAVCTERYCFAYRPQDFKCTSWE